MFTLMIPPALSGLLMILMGLHFDEPRVTTCGLIIVGYDIVLSTFNTVVQLIKGSAS